MTPRLKCASESQSVISTKIIATGGEQSKQHRVPFQNDQVLVTFGTRQHFSTLGQSQYSMPLLWNAVFMPFALQGRRDGKSLLCGILHEIRWVL